MQEPAPSFASDASQRGDAMGPMTIAAGVFIDALLVFDAAVRWYSGLGFLAEGKWWLVNGVVLAGCLLLGRALVLRQAAGWVSAFLSCLLLSVSFLTASESSQLFNWRAAPLFGDFFFENGLVLTFLATGGPLGALIGGVAHGVVSANYRYHARRPTLDSVPWFGVTLGVALAITSAVALAPVVQDPGSYDEAKREMFWGVVFAVSLVLSAVGVSTILLRWRWLRRVRKGLVPGFAVVGEHEFESLPVVRYQRLSARHTGHVLVSTVGAERVVIARVR